MPFEDPSVAHLRVAVTRIAELTRDRVRHGVSHQDADDDQGTLATDDAIGFNPFPLLRAAAACGVKVVVIGQVAGIMHGSQELTGDLDLLWGGEPDQAEALAAAFRDVDAVVSDDDERPMPCEADAFRLPKVLFRTATASGDCCTLALPWGALPMRDFLDRAVVAVTSDGYPIHYLDRDDLIAMRRAVGRVKDLRRAAELEGQPRSC